MELGKKIQQVLQHYPSVYVNGLGVFHQVHQASIYDEKRNVFLPPVDYIEFDAAATEGINLTDYIYQESGISRSEAEDLIKDKVDALKHALREYGQVTIEQLGDLIQYGEGIVFKALDLSAFNLSPVQNKGTNPFSRKESSIETSVDDNSGDNDAQVDINEETNMEPAGIFNAEETVEDVPVNVVSNEDIPAVDSFVEGTEEEYDMKQGASRGWYIVLAIVGLSIAGVLWYMNRVPTSNTENSHLQYNGVEDETVVPSVITDTTDTLLSINSVDTGLTQYVSTENQDKNIREVVIPSNHTWYIVIASHLPMVDAVAFKEKFNKNGHVSVRVLPHRSNNNVANVIWDSYVTKEEADSALRHVRRNFVSDAWHTTVKK